MCSETGSFKTWIKNTKMAFDSKILCRDSYPFGGKSGPTHLLTKRESDSDYEHRMSVLSHAEKTKQQKEHTIITITTN